MCNLSASWTWQFFKSSTNRQGSLVRSRVKPILKLQMLLKRQWKRMLSVWVARACRTSWQTCKRKSSAWKRSRIICKNKSWNAVAHRRFQTTCETIDLTVAPTVRPTSQLSRIFARPAKHSSRWLDRLRQAGYASRVSSVSERAPSVETMQQVVHGAWPL